VMTLIFGQMLVGHTMNKDDHLISDFGLDVIQLIVYHELLDFSSRRNIGEI
jgi:hypothetical protein